MANLLSYFNENGIEAGCDEAGRGCLAGPVVAAAVILPKDFHHPLLNDSKQLTERQRQVLRPIIESESLAFAVSFLTPAEIDNLNILKASLIGMHRAVDQLSIRPDRLLIDGNRFIPYPEIEHVCIIKGDSIYKSIAAASVLAKTYRDDFMTVLDEEFPVYNWKKNKGYPTQEHRVGIQKFGESPHHRRTFRLLKDDQMRLFD
jgi:ribonuclease HII